MLTHKIFKLFCSKAVNLSNKKVIIFGAGNTALLYNNCFIREKINIYAFCDSNTAKIGTTFLNKKVISLSELKQIKDSYVLVCSGNIKNTNQIITTLKENNINYSLIDNYLFNLHQKDILKVLNLLEDDLSKKTYLDLLYARMTNQEIEEEIFMPNKYFYLRDFFQNNNSQVFVDLGSYIGDSIEQYLFSHEGVFDKIYAFEPDIDNYKALKSRKKRLLKEWNISKDRLIIESYSLGKTKQKISYTKSYNNFGLGTIITSNTTNNTKSIMTTIDDYFKEKQISFLKADIESYEYDTLLGASKVIKRDKPLLAICIYHNASDMYDIPLLIHKINKDYKFKIRHHSYDYAETVLYVNNT